MVQNTTIAGAANQYVSQLTLIQVRAWQDMQVGPLEGMVAGKLKSLF
jgi:hypothetical protein